MASDGTRRGRGEGKWRRGGQEGRRFGKRRARREAKTLRRSIPSLRATRFRSPAASMHQRVGQRTREDVQAERARGTSWRETGAKEEQKRRDS